METISELIQALFILCLGITILTETFYHIITDKIKQKKQHHGHTPPTSPDAYGVDKEEEGKKGVFSHTGNGASCLHAFLLHSIIYSKQFIIKI